MASRELVVVVVVVVVMDEAGTKHCILPGTMTLEVEGHGRLTKDSIVGWVRSNVGEIIATMGLVVPIMRASCALSRWYWRRQALRAKVRTLLDLYRGQYSVGYT